MLLTITYQGEQPGDLGYLLFKNPSRPQEFNLNFGKAYVFYPRLDEKACTAALLLDIDPIDLARGKVGSKDGGLFDYVNDRPYVSSSFMSTAIARVFGTAMTGRCEEKPELAEAALLLSATITTLPCKGDTGMLNRVFEPLGYTVDYTNSVLDESYPAWGESKYVNLTLKGTVRLQDLLHHLYVLIPVFDRKKHYWIGKNEVDKLLRHGEGWLETHPEKAFITQRYVGGRRSLVGLAMEGLALDRMDDGQAGSVMQENPDETDAPAEKKVSLNTQRLVAVVEELKKAGAASVIDLGCGEGNLLNLLVRESFFKRIAGTDVSWSALERAAQRLKPDRLSDTQREKLTLFHSSLIYQDDRFQGYDAACVVEVIEHMDIGRLHAFEEILFGQTRPRTVVLTTPNREYNENYENLAGDSLRHGDHRFEWTRTEFGDWARGIAEKYGYALALGQMGEVDEKFGAPTQMGVFTLCE